MNQAELFREVAVGGFGGGFAYGASLPAEKGVIDQFKIIEYEASDGPTINVLTSWLISSLEEEPCHVLEQRDRQLRAVLNDLFKKHPQVVLIIKGAHLLRSNDIKSLKSIRENSDGSKLGFVLVGDIQALEKKIIAIPEIATRAIKIT